MFRLILVRFNLAASPSPADHAASSSRCWAARVVVAARRSILAFALGGLWIAAAAAQEPLFERTGERLLPGSRQGVEVIERIRVNTTLLRTGKFARVQLPLPAENVIVTLQPISPKTINLPAHQQAWRGTIDDKVGGSVFFLIGRDFVRGQITRKDRVYVVRSIGERREVLEVIDPQRAFPDDHPRDIDLDQFNIQGRADQREIPMLADCGDPIDQVDVMVLYTPAARIAAGGTVSIEAEVAFAVAQANIAYYNSHVFHRLNLVYTGEVDLAEPAGGISLATALTNLQSTTDGVMDEVHALRDSYKADLVSLLVESTTGGSGIGYRIDPPDSTKDHRGFSVVKRDTAATNYSLAHEIGHNMSAHHDRANANGSSSRNYAYGHIQPIPSTSGVGPWRTVMSYADPCATLAGEPCTRIPYFSNPTISWSGDSTGVPLTAALPEHNVQAMADAASVVARFRCRTSSAIANAWMKDRWEDTGAEPDPATAGKAMWQSPYIWVRNSQDTTLIHQHEHENPELGSTNYVYVKMHNDGIASASGSLELYWASASTNLNNPANWNLIASQSVSSLASGTSVIEFPWSSLPGAGHFCLMARWNESGMPLAFTNLDSAVRSSNDMIWRNVEIIDLVVGDADMERVIVVRGSPETQETWLLFTGRVMNGREVPWKEIASLKLHFNGKIDPSVLTVEGLQQVGPDTFELTLAEAVASLGPLRLGPGEELKVLVKPSVNAALAAKAQASIANSALFEINVMQVLGSAIKGAASTQEELFRSQKLVFGGVTYQVRLRPPSRK